MLDVFLTGCRQFATLTVLLGVTSLAAAQPVSATLEAHDDIRALAERFAHEQLDTRVLSDVQVQAATLDPRLKLAACDVPLEAFATGNVQQPVARTTVGVRCSGRSPWTLYVPVTVEALADVVVARRPLLRGETLTRDALVVARMPLTRLPPRHLSKPDQLTGMELTRPLQPDMPVTLNTVRPRQLVKQGQEVVILAVTGSIEVRMSGVALRNGSRGDLIPVRNHSSGRRLEAEILDQDTVRVRF